MNNSLMVVIQMLTYNHEKFIAQAIESVMMQQTNFKYKLIICEDFSTDNTRSICIEYKNKYPDKIELILNEINLGVKINAKQVHKLCFKSGAKYTAILEGDDYWTDPLKLQKQVDFLEANDDYVFCFHNALFLKNDQQIGFLRDSYTDKKDTYHFEDFLTTGVQCAHTASYLFRNNLFDIPSDFHKCELGDWGMKVLISEHGKSKYLDEVMSAYRIHDGGVYSGVGLKKSLNTLNSKQYINSYYNDQFYDKIFPKYSLLILNWDILNYYCSKHDLKKAIYYMVQVIVAQKFELNNPYQITRLGTIKRFIKTFIIKKKRSDNSVN